MFPNKVKVYEQMRESEEAINAFMKQRLLAAKEDLLQNNSRVKRNMRIMVEVTHSIPSTKHLSSTDWKVRVEGRVQGLQSEEETLKADGNRFLNYIEKIKLEFPGSEDLYPTVDWVKAKSGSGATIDCIEVTRSINKEQKKKLNNSPIKVKLSLCLENNPPRYRISAPLSRILGGIEEATRLQVLGALWQYIKSNRLQDPDNREKILCNQELSEVFYCPIGKERLEFSEIVFRLKDHLTDIPPLELSFDVNVHSPVPKMGQAPTTDAFYYDLTVFEHGGHHKEYIDFLVNCEYDFYSQQAPDDLFAEPSDKTNKLVLNGAALKRREQKYDEKIGASIDALKRSYKQMQFFNRLSGNVRASLSSTIIEQNKWLRIMQEEQPSMYETSYETASQTVEHENAQFYQDNQSWLLGEIEQYLKKQREEKEAQAEGENGKKQQSESEREDNEY
ncbi:hypothetical protein FGO68_gene14294 [Halteria grandinella]|uniref:DM2 domain-containing protein n=1 Tax=Halteria grandinella TaxID=5974 RepID=A0A8J8T387_HALGN|nr:hypothetical protein FGO68_gene14294 [Halteria grandinella]